ncbi:conserved hypothetical protein [Flavobacterium psychrophilum]|uniref:hypothetical protein n=1 Tax=Flavobacterium psychrophilum TaxID=96345 RepID=UPI000B7C1244|nr:hypothetical protein [Flavobacterium psychrophilum]SNB26037.1 conserved hypothetical protein [Flavobacterium psychrophilum]SNB33287.1 conserved hypothetical protein [Flavobacterium psychrophilum]SNB35987.1 conserved exported hypothetical protein [Flavobacterium psychrophilum]
MKKIISISFLFIFLYANTEIGQLLKLPNLIHHFIEHRQHKGERSVSFIDFVKSHYNDNVKHADTDKHDEHKNLPFKTSNTNLNTIITFENQPNISFRKPISIVINKTVGFHKQFYTSNVLACIWLPPKLS